MRLNRRDTSRRVIKRRVTRTLYIIQTGARSVIAHRCFCAPASFPCNNCLAISPPSRSRACFIQLPLENCLNVAHATIFHEFQEGRGKNSNRDSRERERKFLACIFFLKHASFTAKYSYKLAIRLANGNPSKSKRKKKQRRNNIFDCFEPYPVTCSYFYLLPSYGGLASFLFSPLIGQVFRRECRIGGASEFTPSSSVVLQSKSCADPLPSRRPLPSILSFSSRFSSFPSARPLLISLARKISSAVTRLRPCLPPSLLKDYRRRVDGSIN